MGMNFKSNIIDNYKGENIIEYEFENENGIKVGVLNLGGIITKIMTPDKEGNYENIVLSYNNIEDYFENDCYYGATVGRTAGRIYNGIVTIEGKEYKLNNNYVVNQCHGGNIGFDKKIWTVKPIIEKDKVGVTLYYLSKRMEENYPGNLRCEVSYTLNNEDELEFLAVANTDETTLVNITNHSYFNLSGNYKDDILDNELQMNAENILEIEETGAVTGKILPVYENKAFDFTKRKTIKEHINAEHKQIKLGNGYDHPFVFRENEDGLISLNDKKSGRGMDIETNNEAVVIYTMNYPNDKALKGNIKPRQRLGVCFETQAPPIGINQCFLEKSILKPDETYSKYTKYKFYLI
ncbi:aldose 1-epimerase [Clostridium cavendishii DSM 21758]|uniref:Aldose 1-epimerase n=1 Tax=Clostridium cavendishii DSM 21758 TaxID=1121302 RepID=A0A1M6BNF6_9CLOT|nr:aldose epimerase family protein [Clostridium cavendishii]SHI50255.1 aldose 1-epimerase [Clostridium cavendishii DSM 21758]